MISTLPRSIALREAERERRAFLDLPYEPLRVTIEAVWHQRVDQEAGLQWFLSEVMQAVADLNDQEAKPPHLCQPHQRAGAVCRNSSRQPGPDCRSDEILLHHLPNLAAASVQHGPNRIQRHAFGRIEFNRWGHDELHRRNLHIEQRRSRLS
jgi:hypothetical protein